jgi:hypothetical protein
MTFAVEIWRYIMDHVVAGAPLISLEDRFRYRGLMLCTTATEDADTADDDDNFFVATFHDAPFDEQVHSEWHALRSPGCYKRVASADTVPGLCSVGQGHTSYAVVHEEKGFLPSNRGRAPDSVWWCRNLVTLREAAISMV